jgi:serine/threonine-protein kinase
MPSPNADRNLLFGILALQMDFINREALVQAMHAWVLEKARPLGDILVARGALRNERRMLLEALVQEHLNQHGDDPQKSLAALTSIGSARGDLEQIGDAELQASIAQVSTTGSFDRYATRAPSVGEATSAGTRFRILRPHARGGLGEVFIAEDNELHREVALKEIQNRHADNSDSRTRFLMEAEITGSLEHPGIVPVYGLGQYADGRPFYAMRFIRGDSLKEAIKRYHKDGDTQQDPGERAVQLRKLLGRFLDVCNAIAYAHSRGVLHRDLKPGNIMLGKYGETLVVDWGLAKSLGRNESASDEAPLTAPLQGGTAGTIAGSAMGTPPFMSPEQAAGRLDQLGPASDVYSLGATLYCLLTGKPPFTDTDAGAVLQKVQRGDFPAPRQVRRDAPKALEAICLKAMALKRESRYATPRQLADDVEHWLADEPVTAYREPVRARLRRWGRRHRTAVTAAAAALLVAVVGLVTATVLLTAANDRERKAKEAAKANEIEANKQRDKARDRFNLAREAVDKFHTQVSESPEMKSRGVEKLRSKLLESAVEFYQKLAQEEGGNDPAVLQEQGQTFARLADLYSTISRQTQAEEAYDRALAIRQKLAAEHVTSAEYQKDLADSHNKLGLLYRDTGRHDLAEKAHRQGMAIRQKLVAGHPTVAAYQYDLADSFNALGLLYRATGRYADAEKAFLDVIAIQRKLVAEQPTVLLYQKDLGTIHHNLGLLYRATGRHTDAEKAYLDALAIRKKLADKRPNVPKFQIDLAGIYGDLAALYSATERTADAEKACLDSAAIQKKLADEHPTVTQYQSDLARSYNNLGNLYQATDRNAEAEKAFLDALAIRKELAVENAAVPKYQSDLATSYNNLGAFCRDRGRHADAEKAFQDALAIQQSLADEHPTITQYQGELARGHNNLGNLYRATGRHADAEKAHLVALAIRKKLAAEHPTVPKYQSDLATSYNNLGALYGTTERTADAEKAFLDATSIQRDLAAEHPTVSQCQVDLARSQNNLGSLYRATGRTADAEKSYLGALAIYQKLAAQNPNVPAYQRDLGATLYNLALVSSVAAVAIAKDPKLSVAERKQSADEAAARAMEFLAKANAAGFFKTAANITAMKNDTHLRPLRGRTDFKKLLADLEEKAKASD